MKEKKELVNENQQPIYIMAQPNIQEDEIDLFELGLELWKKKIVIIAITAIVTIIGIVVALIIPETYEAKAIFVTPNKSDFEHLNTVLKTMGKSKINKNLLVNLFLSKINSKQIRKEIFDKYGYKKFYETENKQGSEWKMFESFNEDFIVSAKKDKKSKEIEEINVSYKGASPKEVADVVTKISNDCILKANEQLKNNILSQIRSEEDLLESKISGLRNNALTNFTNKLKKAESAYQIAMKANITDILKNADGELPRMLSTLEYLKGTKVLGAEIEEIKKKLSLNKNDLDAFIGVAGLLAKLEQLKTIKIDSKLIKTVNIDTPAYPPTNRIAPKRSLIVIGGGFIGVLFSFIWILLLFLIRKNSAIINSKQII